jgi:GDPmannose 4,6-dehydratase
MKHYLIYSCLFFVLVVSAQKKALIFGITGQDGSYLAELLLSKGYKVHGVKRRTSVINTVLIDHLYEGPEEKDRNFIMHYGDLSDSANIVHLVQTLQPDEIYNLAAQSHVLVSFELPEYTGNIDGLGVLRILEAIRVCGLTHKTRFYQASTSEMFGKVMEIPQRETTPFYPRSPYGVAKLYGYWITKNYRESYGMFACNGILFNHESPRRGETFVTRKIVRALVAIKHGLQDCLYLGNLDASRDWGHAKDYVYAMWLMLQQEVADDFVIGSGETHTVREFVERTCIHLGITLLWRGTGIDEQGYDAQTGAVIVRIDPRYFRPAEVDYLLADSTRGMTQLGWRPQYSFESLVQEMVDAEQQKLIGNKRGNL